MVQFRGSPAVKRRDARIVSWFTNTYRMNTKLLLAILVSAVAAFLAGWLIFGIGLMGYYEANTVHYEGLMKSKDDMNLGLIFVGNLLFAAMVSWACSRMGVNTILGGLVAGGIMGALVYASVDVMFMAFMNLYSNNMVVVVDILANAVWAAIIGAVAGWMLGMGKKAA